MPEFSPLFLHTRRHHWVWLAETWTACLEEPLSAAAANAVAGWVARERPFVVARRRPDDRADSLRLGLSTLGKDRIALLVDRAAIIRQEPPPTIEQVLPTAPAPWHAILDAVHTAADQTETEAAIFGSLAWQYWSGESFVRADSDIDLLLSPPHWAAVDRLLARLSVHEAALPRLDGELLLPDGSAVAWREWASAAATLLVKTERDVAMRSRQSILTLLPEGEG
jgi:phosphoribosyl-dephospho-CoA transferase